MQQPLAITFDGDLLLKQDEVNRLKEFIRTSGIDPEAYYFLVQELGNLYALRAQEKQQAEALKKDNTDNQQQP